MRTEKQREYERVWVTNNIKRKCFQRHKSTAKQRSIKFLFSFDEWVEFWGSDFENRGIKGDQLCCARIGDVGPYTTDNCFIVTNTENRLNIYAT